MHGLKRHMEAQHDSTVYPCHKCMKVYTRAYRLEEHLEKGCTPKIGNATIVNVTKVEDWLKGLNSNTEAGTQKAESSSSTQPSTSGAITKIKTVIKPRPHSDWTRRVPVDRGHSQSRHQTPTSVKPKAPTLTQTANIKGIVQDVVRQQNCTIKPMNILSLSEDNSKSFDWVDSVENSDNPFVNPNMIGGDKTEKLDSDTLRDIDLHLSDSDSNESSLSKYDERLQAMIREDTDAETVSRSTPTSPKTVNSYLREATTSVTQEIPFEQATVPTNRINRTMSALTSITENCRRLTEESQKISPTLIEDLARLMEQHTAYIFDNPDFID